MSKGAAVRKHLRFVALVILLPGVFFFVMNVLLGNAHRKSSYVPQIQYLSVFFALLGSVIFAAGELGKSRRHRGESTPARQDDMESIERGERIGILLLILGVTSTFFFLYVRQPNSISEVTHVVRLLTLGLIPFGLLWMFAARLVALSSQLSVTAGERRYTAESRDTRIRFSRRLELVCGWGLWGGMGGAILFGIVPARHWPLVWPMMGDSKGLGLDAMFTVAAWVSGAVAALCALSWMGATSRRVYLETGSGRASKLGVTIGVLALVAGIWGWSDIVAVVKHFPYFRMGEVWAILIGGGVFLVGRSCLPRFGFLHGITVFVGGAGVALYAVIFLESWFSTQVPMFWSRGFLGAFLPGLMLLILGFSRKPLWPGA